MESDKPDKSNLSSEQIKEDKREVEKETYKKVDFSISMIKLQEVKKAQGP